MGNIIQYRIDNNQEIKPSDHVKIGCQHCNFQGMCLECINMLRGE